MAIITISREMGTGAHQIAEDVARKLKYTLVDGAKIAEVASRYGLTADMLMRVDEKPPVYITAEDRLQAANLNMIELILLDFAKAGDVILYGRGCQDLLKGIGNLLRVRFIAPFEERVENEGAIIKGLDSFIFILTESGTIPSAMIRYSTLLF